MSIMYVLKSRRGNFYELRQTRYKERLQRGQPEHPNDICVIASSLDEMHTMADGYWPEIDYSLAELHPWEIQRCYCSEGDGYYNPCPIHGERQNNV